MNLSTNASYSSSPSPLMASKFEKSTPPAARSMSFSVKPNCSMSKSASPSSSCASSPLSHSASSPTRLSARRYAAHCSGVRSDATTTGTCVISSASAAL